MQFSDFRIEILAARDDAFLIKVASQASGELQATIRLKRSVNALLDAVRFTGSNVRGASAIREIERGIDTPAEPACDVGQELFETLFSTPEVNRALAECMTDAKNNGVGVRLKLTMNTTDETVAELARLPWELLHDESKYKYFGLRPDSPIVRYLEVPKPLEAQALRPPLRILVVSSNPRNDLALDQERENLKQALGDDPNIELDFVEAATIQTIAAKLAESARMGRDFHVLHYMGHGGFEHGKGVLVLHRERGGEDHVDADAFNTALQASESIRLVFLNACNTAQSGGTEGADPFAGVATALVFEGVPAVVAMQRPLPDGAAITLAKHFYPNIAKGWPVDAAVSEGRRQMFFSDRSSLDWAIPVLFMRSPNGVLFDLAEAPVVVAPPAEAPRRAMPSPRDATVHAPRSRGWRMAAIGGGLVVALGAVAFAANAWRTPMAPIASILLEAPRDTLEQGREGSIGLSLSIGGEVLRGAAAHAELLRRGLRAELRTKDTTFRADSLGAFALAGLRLGSTPMSPVVVDRDGSDTNVPTRTYSVMLLIPADAQMAAIREFTSAKKVADSASVPDSVLVDRLQHVGKEHGATLADVGQDAEMMAWIRRAVGLVQARARYDSLANDADATVWEQREALEAYASAATEVRGSGYGPTRAADSAKLARPPVGRVQSAGVCVSPCRSYTKPLQFATGRKVDIYLAYSGGNSGSLTVEWRVGGLTKRTKQLGVGTNAGYHTWDTMNLDQSGAWEVRVLNAKHELVYRHTFTVN